MQAVKRRNRRWRKSRKLRRSLSSHKRNISRTARYSHPFCPSPHPPLCNYGPAGPLRCTIYIYVWLVVSLCKIAYNFREWSEASFWSPPTQSCLTLTWTTLLLWSMEHRSTAFQPPSVSSQASPSSTTSPPCACAANHSKFKVKLDCSHFFIW